MITLDKSLKVAVGTVLIMFLSGCSHTLNDRDPGAIKQEYPEAQIPDPQALELFMDAQLMMSQGDFSNAIINLQDALRIDPNVSTIYLALGECYGQIGKLELAEERLLKAIELDPGEKDAHRMLSNIYMSMEEYTKAENVFLTLRELDPEDPDVYYALADLHRYLKNYRKAAEYYREAYDAHPVSLKPLELASELAFKAKDMVLAQELYSIMVEAEPDNIQVLKAFADLALINKDTTKGLETVRKISELDSATNSDRIRYGAILFEFGKVDSSLSILMEVLQSDPDNSEAMHLISRIYRSQKDFLNSDAYAERLVKAHPGDPRGYINLALNAFDNDKPEDVIDILGSLSDTFHENFSIQYILGMAYYLSENDSLALVYLNRSVELNETATQAWHAIAVMEDKNRNFSRSDKIYLNLIDQDSLDAQAYNNYAYSLVERNINFDKAMKFARKALDLDPDNAAYLDTYGWIQYKRGNLKIALEYIERSAELNDKNEVILEHLGDVYRALDNTEESLKYYQKVLQINPDNKSVKDKIEN